VLRDRCLCTNVARLGKKHFMKKNEIRSVVKEIEIKHRDSVEGKLQRDAFRSRWAVYPDQISRLILQFWELWN